LDTLGKDEKGFIELGVFYCQGGVSANQVFSLSHKAELRREDLCCFADNNPGSNVKMITCNDNQNQKWSHIKVKNLIIIIIIITF
jgi:polypeptide N-acetylgalactosaminyltransferase